MYLRRPSPGYGDSGHAKAGVNYPRQSATSCAYDQSSLYRRVHDRAEAG
jgi:hypothetical protein